MAQFGEETSVYLQDNLLKLIDKAVETDKERFKSRSQFINSAVHKRLRELGLLPQQEVQMK